MNSLSSLDTTTWGMPFTPETIVFDLHTEFGVDGAPSYTPQNYDGGFRGPVTLKRSPASRVGQSVSSAITGEAKARPSTTANIAKK